MLLNNLHKFSWSYFDKLVFLQISIILFVFLVSLVLKFINYILKQEIFFNFFKYLNLVLLVILSLSLLIKLFIFKYLNFKYQLNLDYVLTMQFSQPLFSLNLNFKFYYTFFGDIILLLCFLVTFITILVLGDKNLFNNLIGMLYFNFFLVCTIILTTTTNMLIMFISFEFIFLPSLYFVYSLGYSRKVEATVGHLLLWTLSGSFLVLCGMCYLFYSAHSLDYFIIKEFKFTLYESLLLFFVFFIGFGTKIPIYPFYYWLIKVHVEAPAGFSIFLSGFLVKTAVYCLYYFLSLVGTELCCTLSILLVLCGATFTSLNMWIQVDIKKLVAYATIQEMNLILLSLFLTQLHVHKIVIIFLLFHGILSSFLFYLVDVIQKKTQTRVIEVLSGLSSIIPQLKYLIWVQLFFFLGIPLTIKFIIEFFILYQLIINFGIVGVLCFFIISGIGTIGYTKNWLLILYGVPRVNFNKIYITSISYKNFLIIGFLMLIVFSLTFCFLF